MPPLALDLRKRGTSGADTTSRQRPAILAAFPVLRTLDDDALQLGQVTQFLPYEARDVFHRWRAEALHVVEHPVVERVARNLDAAFQVAHVDHPAAFGERTAHPHFHLVRMTVDVPVARIAAGTGVQLMRGVETEFLPDGEEGFAHGMPRYLWVCRLKRQCGCALQ